MFRQISSFTWKRWTALAFHSRLACLTLPVFISLALLSLLLLSLRGSAPHAHAAAPAQATISATPWKIFTPVDITTTNLLTNSSFETATVVNAVGWEHYESGYTVDETVAHSGTRSLKLVNSTTTDTYGALQIVTLSQTERLPIYFGGWSKAECVSGGADQNYSVYLDLEYNDGTPSFGHVIEFDACSHDWQFRDALIVPEKPIQEMRVHCLLRWTHRGTVWFDDLTVQQAPAETTIFDSVLITASQPPALDISDTLSLATGDGLILTLSAEGGTVVSVTLGTTEVQDSEHTYASGFFVRDVAAESDFVHVGGSLVETGGRIVHDGSIPELGLDFSAVYTTAADRITIHAEVSNTQVGEDERALTLYFALPIRDTGEWIWGDDIRNSRPSEGLYEFANFSDEHRGIGANGHLSKYPWAGLSSYSSGGIALAVPLDGPSVMRLIYNPATRQFYAAFDLGLSPHTTDFPGRAWADLVLYRFDPAWGLRAAAQGYYDRFREAFTRTIPPEQEGIWIAFSDLDEIGDVDDFYVGFHELSNLDYVSADEEHGALSLRYIAEPQSHWLPVNDSSVDAYDYDQVTAYLHGQYGWPNLLLNARFEKGPPDSADHWRDVLDYTSTYTLDQAGGRDGGRALKLINSGGGDVRGAEQVITLNQTISRPLYFSGWSKAKSVSGDPGDGYSLYLEFYDAAETRLYTQALAFDINNSDWQFREGFIVPTQAIQSVRVRCLLSATHSGTAWFDGLNVHEVIFFPNLLTNPGFEKGSTGSADYWGCYGSGCTIDETGGRDDERALHLTNSIVGDAQYALQTITLDQSEPRPLYFSGWSKAEGVTGVPDEDYSLYLDVYYAGGGSLWGQVLTFDTGTHDWQFNRGFIVPTQAVRSINVHGLLRALHTGTVWFDDLSVQQVVPWLPNQLTNAAFEDGPSDSASYWWPYGSGYGLDSDGGRGDSRALQLTNTVSISRHGAWQDVTLNQAVSRPLYLSGWSKAAGVTGTPDENYSLYLDMYKTGGDWYRALVRPFDTGTHTWQFQEGFLVPDETIQSLNVHCLLRDTHSGTAWFDDLMVQALGEQSEKSQATLSSGLFNECGRYRQQPYEAGAVPWCKDRAGCVYFTVNPDPGIDDPDYPLNKAHLEWNQAARDVYTGTPDLDGEYMDSFLARATAMDFRIAHLAASDTPLSYQTGNRRVGVPLVFAVVEYARWMAQDVHENDKWMMANWILRDLPWGADLFDVMGTEINWLDNDGNFAPESDPTLNYRRTLAFQRPYGLLMNTNFYSLTHDLVEDYFQLSLFYGFYPGMFSHNAADAPYWENSSLYDRDRDLFRRYVPLIRRLNYVGWQPLTYAKTDTSTVQIERFGAWPELYFTLYNASETETITVTVTLYNDDLNLPTSTLTVTTLLSRSRHPLSVLSSTHTRALTIPLAPRSGEILFVKDAITFTIRDTFGPRLLQPDDYSRYDFHRGIDLPAAEGTPVYAVADGVVRSVRKTWPDGAIGSGKFVHLTHQEPDLETRYNHLRDVYVSPGDVVSSGQMIGRVGSSGALYDHLHFEVREGVNVTQRAAVHPLIYGEFLQWTNEQTPTVTLRGVYTDATGLTALVQAGSTYTEPDVTDVRVAVSGSVSDSRVIDYAALNAGTPIVADLDDPLVNDVCIIPSDLITEEGYSVMLAFRRLADDSSLTVTAWVTDVGGLSDKATAGSVGGLQITPPEQRGYGVPEQTVTFAYTITNYSDPENITLTHLSAQGWPAVITPQKSGDSIQVTVEITVNTNRFGPPDCGLLIAETVSGTQRITAGFYRIYRDAYVSGGTGDDAYTGSRTAPLATISHAINRTDDGGTVYVARGEWYTENLVLEKTIDLLGGYDAANWTITPTLALFSTTVNGGRNGAVLTIDGDYGPLVEGFTFYNGYRSGGAGGGVRLVGGAAPTLRSNWIVSNEAALSGGGIYVGSYGTMAPAMINNTITGNASGSSEGGGGGVYVQDRPALVQGNVISGNRATHNGGGIYLTGNTTAQVIGNRILSNTASNNGGGVLVRSSGVYFVNDVVADNQAGGAGNGLYVWGAWPRLLHTTIARNGDVGSGLYVTDRSGIYSDVILTNTILVSHALGVTAAAGNSVTLAGVLWGNDKNRDGGYITASREITGNPDFLGKGDYHLGPDSDAIDNGVEAGVNTDLDGLPRPYKKPDLGAYEAQPVLSLAKYVDDPTPGPEQLITYTVIVENSGVLSATDALISDRLPDGLTFAGPITLTPPTAGSTGDYPTLAYSLTIVPGTRINVTFPVTVDWGTAAGVIVNTASVTSAQVITPQVGVREIIVQNVAPVADDDSFDVDEDSSNNALDVLDGDGDANNDTLTVYAVGAPDQGGTATNNYTNVLYTPTLNFFGTEVFTYTVTDGNGEYDTATVTVTVKNTNDAPSGSDDAYTTPYETVLNVSAESGVLSNDQDLDGDSLTASLMDSPLHGFLALSLDGSFVYTPTDGFSGEDTFGYIVSDGELTDTSRVTITVGAPNTAPTISDIDNQRTFINTTLGPISFTIEDAETPPDELLLSKESSHQTLVSPANIGLGGSGTNRTVTITPTTGMTGMATITITVSDGELSDYAAFVLTVERFRIYLPLLLKTE